MSDFTLRCSDTARRKKLQSCKRVGAIQMTSQHLEIYVNPTRGSCQSELPRMGVVGQGVPERSCRIFLIDFDSGNSFFHARKWDLLSSHSANHGQYLTKDSLVLSFPSACVSRGHL